MLVELFVVGSLWFWALMVVVGIIELIAVANEGYGFSICGLVAYLGLLQFCTNANPWGVVKDNPGWVIVGVLSYLLFGVVWMVLKWRKFVKDYVAEYKASHSDGAAMPRILVGYYKEKLMAWCALWPFSLGAFLLTDLVRSIYESIYNALAEWLQRMSDNLVKKLYQ